MFHVYLVFELNFNYGLKRFNVENAVEFMVNHYLLYFTICVQLL